MFIIVNSITIKIHSKAFHASFELWQLQGYSVNPSWQQSDLRLTRITDPRRGEVTALAFWGLCEQRDLKQEKPLKDAIPGWMELSPLLENLGPFLPSVTAQIQTWTTAFCCWDA